jgi:hypothetical protein
MVELSAICSNATMEIAVSRLRDRVEVREGGPRQVSLLSGRVQSKEYVRDNYERNRRENREY